MIETKATELPALSIEARQDVDGSEGEPAGRGLGSRDLHCLQQALRKEKAKALLETTDHRPQHHRDRLRGRL